MSRSQIDEFISGNLEGPPGIGGSAVAAQKVEVILKCNGAISARQHS